jgi:3-deoxy-D-manno-octulosonic-acid transferase
MLGLYNTVLLPLRLAVEAWSLWRSRTPAGRAEWAERRGRRLPRCRAGGVWIHGASVGEARIAASVAGAVRSRRPDLPLVVSATTRAGREQLPPSSGVDAAFFVPLDFAGVVRRTVRGLRPAALVLVETELWPNLLAQAHGAGVPVVVLNGRLTPQRMAAYRRLRRLFGPLVGRLAACGAQSEADAARFVELGAPPAGVVVTGNVKYDLPLPAEGPAELRGRLRLAEGRPVFVAGSTAAGEDALVLDAFARARAASGDLLLVLAPRHVRRSADVAALLQERGHAAARLSEAPDLRDKDVLLVDSVGQLPALYQLGSVAFVGGSLVPVGGHNVLEPAAVGVPVLFGPHTETVSDPAAALVRAGGGARVADASALGDELARLLGDAGARAGMAEAASRIVRASRGALERSVTLLLGVLERASPRAGAA